MLIKVLIADDEYSIADSLAVILTHHGFAARAVYDGESAVNLTAVWRPDIVLTDVTMPGMSGYEAALQIHAILPHCRSCSFQRTSTRRMRFAACRRRRPSSSLRSQSSRTLSWISCGCPLMTFPER